MQVALKVWRFDSVTGERALREYEVDAPEHATLLDCLSLVKDRRDGTLSFRRGCRTLSCGACGMRLDGVSVLACKTRMADVAAAGRTPVVSAMGNLPIVKDLVVDLGPFWDKYRAMRPWLEPGYSAPEDGGGYRLAQADVGVVRKESACINCGCCVSECDSLESDPEFLGPHALAQGMRFVGDPRDGRTVERLESYSSEHGIWDCTRCYFCNERCPKGVDPRYAIAKLGAEAVARRVDRDPGARRAQGFVRSTETTGWARRREFLPRLRDARSAEDARFALSLLREEKGRPGPPAVAKDVGEARRLHTVVRSQDRRGALGHVQGEQALSRLERGRPSGGGA